MGFLGGPGKALGGAVGSLGGMAGGAAKAMTGKGGGNTGFTGGSAPSSPAALSGEKKTFSGMAKGMLAKKRAARGRSLSGGR